MIWVFFVLGPLGVYATLIMGLELSREGTRRKGRGFKL